MSKQFFTEKQLAGVAKKFRNQSGKNKSEAATELGVHRATISVAEEKPEQSLTALRIRMIEKYSPYKVVGPVYMLEKRK
jgi:DNA-binding XRE family transcriptional regulator